jgi:hypothetical protein
LGRGNLLARDNQQARDNVQAGLGRATNARYMLRLLSLLACLLVPSKASEVAESAVASMQSILVIVWPHKASSGTMDDDPIWKVLQEPDALKHNLWRLDKHHSAVCAEILAVILERWPRSWPGTEWARLRWSGLSYLISA